ncbi:MAG: metal-dependent hydrolase [Patescibacteria group bacterium]|nr:metal-dependent hydrolase [Patescibacteria group bacterium]
MYPQTHLLAGLAAGEVAASLGAISQPEALLVAGLAMAIDIDHYLYFVIKHGSWSLEKAWNAAVARREEGERTWLHHWWGFVFVSAIIVLLAFFSQAWALILALAYYSHYFLDHVPNSTRQIRFKVLKASFKLSYLEIILDVILILLTIGFIAL